MFKAKMLTKWRIMRTRCATYSMQQRKSILFFSFLIDDWKKYRKINLASEKLNIHLPRDPISPCWAAFRFVQNPTPFFGKVVVLRSDRRRLKLKIQFIYNTINSLCRLLQKSKHDFHLTYTLTNQGYPC